MPYLGIRSGVPGIYPDQRRIDVHWAVRMDLSSGTVRYITKRDGFVGNLDGAPQTWEFWDVQVNGMGQSQAQPLEVSSFSLSNIKGTFTPVFNNFNQKSRPIQVYFVEFDENDHQTLMGKQRIYDGQIDAWETVARLHVSVLPYRNPDAKMMPPWVMGPYCPLVYKGLLCKYAGALPTCGRTLQDCIDHANEINFAGMPWIPKPGDIQTWPPKETFLA